MVDDDELGDRPAGVVGDDRHALEVERRQEVGDQPGDAGRREVSVGVHRDGVRAERQVGDDAAEALGERRHDLLPEPAVDERPVDEDEDLAVASGVAVVDRALRERDLGHDGSLL